MVRKEIKVFKACLRNCVYVWEGAFWIVPFEAILFATLFSNIVLDSHTIQVTLDLQLLV